MVRRAFDRSKFRGRGANNRTHRRCGRARCRTRHWHVSYFLFRSLSCPLCSPTKPGLVIRTIEKKRKMNTGNNKNSSELHVKTMLEILVHTRITFLFPIFFFFYLSIAYLIGGFFIYSMFRAFFFPSSQYRSVRRSGNAEYRKKFWQHGTPIRWVCNILPWFTKQRATKMFSPQIETSVIFSVRQFFVFLFNQLMKFMSNQSYRMLLQMKISIIFDPRTKQLKNDINWLQIKPTTYISFGLILQNPKLRKRRHRRKDEGPYQRRRYNEFINWAYKVWPLLSLASTSLSLTLCHH